MRWLRETLLSKRNRIIWVAEAAEMTEEAMIAVVIRSRAHTKREVDAGEKDVMIEVVVMIDAAAMIDEAEMIDVAEMTEEGLDLKNSLANLIKEEMALVILTCARFSQCKTQGPSLSFKLKTLK
jgi:hypothetical protein